MSGGMEDAARRQKEWDKLKQQGSDHYKTGETEPIDLYKAGGMFNHFSRCSIIKYAYRMKGIEDCDKIIHYATLLRASLAEDNGKKAD